MGKVTKAEALRVFVEERVMGNVECAIDADGQCRYDPAIHGGCAIGRFLPRYDRDFESRSIKSLFSKYPDLRDAFEDPDSVFWMKLQGAHDYLGMHRLEWFQRDLKLAAELA